jgi:hypothetical protein
MWRDARLALVGGRRARASSYWERGMARPWSRPISPRCAPLIADAAGLEGRDHAAPARLGASGKTATRPRPAVSDRKHWRQSAAFWRDLLPG